MRESGYNKQDSDRLSKIYSDIHRLVDSFSGHDTSGNDPYLVKLPTKNVKLEDDSSDETEDIKKLKVKKRKAKKRKR